MGGKSGKGWEWDGRGMDGRGKGGYRGLRCCSSTTKYCYCMVIAVS